MRVYDNSLTPKNPKMPDFKVSTEYYQVENGNEYRLGDTEEYFYDAELAENVDKENAIPSHGILGQGC